ncbi:MAG: DEAD/DEAH box helicase [Cyanobacteria bacterium HKST-UBA02]|nr:DEAD/DEAH box helicase [Cyanobacteria bacterium HKST-UBA02]
MQFKELGLSERMALSLMNLKIVDPTEIQTKVIPETLGGHDIMASAETGSGKTAAYALPIIHQRCRGKAEKRRKAKTLVLVPTRELALQVESQFERFSCGSGLKTVCIYGGASYDRQISAMNRGVDVIVATPGRLFDHITRGTADLSMIEMLVLDEADRMLDMGFMPQVRQIVRRVPDQRQTLMFSATISKGIEEAASEFLKNPKTIRVNTRQLEPSSIEQKVFYCDEAEKESLLLDLLENQPAVKSVLVFTRTRFKAAKICKRLCAANVRAEEIHGSISQSKRERTLARYREGRFSVLVATDIAARGLDVPEISHVVNYDLPDSAEDYVHRIGRTGRAGRTGTALTFISAQQRHLVRGIEQVVGRRLGDDPNGDDMGAGFKRPQKSRPGKFKNKSFDGPAHGKQGHSRPAHKPARSKPYSEQGRSRQEYSDQPRYKPAYSDQGRNSEGRYSDQPRYKPAYSDQGRSKPAYSDQPRYKPAYSDQGRSKPSYSDQPRYKPAYSDQGRNSEGRYSDGRYSDQPRYKPAYSDQGRNSEGRYSEGRYSDQPRSKPAYSEQGRSKPGRSKPAHSRPSNSKPAHARHRKKSQTFR